jgi:hypothetical protein
MNPYIASGTQIATCLGRQQQLDTLSGRLVRDTPAHVSIVVPKRYGKTVLITHLAELMRQTDSGFEAVSLIDLRRDAPQTDDEFRRRLADGLRETLDPIDSELAKELRNASEELLGEMLQIVLDSFGETGRRVLILFDGFDFVPVGAGVTVNMLDQLRSLAQGKALPSACPQHRK